MLISQSFEVKQPIDTVWRFFDDIPQVAASIPGANLTKEVTKDKYEGGVAEVKSRDDAKRILVLDASGSDKKGRGAASVLLTASLNQISGGTKVDLSMDLTISGAAANYGRGLVADVTAVLVNTATINMEARMDAIAKGLDPNSVGGAKAASGLSIGINAFKRATGRVLARFFLPYKPVARR